MEVSSVQNLCKHLIFCAIQRCRMSDELCRISIVLKLCPEFNPPLVRISVSDTGVGCNLKEFEALRYATNPISASKFDGVITITTTGISDNEIHTFSLNINETISSGRLTKLSSISKCGAKFSGTEAVLSTAESLNDLQSDISLFLHKMSMVKLPGGNLAGQDICQRKVLRIATLLSSQEPRMNVVDILRWPMLDRAQ